MVFGLFGRKDAKPVEAPVEVRKAPLGLQVNRGVEIDLLQYALVSDRLGMPVDARATLVVVAHGIVSLGEGRYLHRLYADDHRFLQVMCDGAREDATVLDVSYMRPWDSVVPGDALEWREWDGQGGKIGAKTYDADGTIFDRFWNAEVDRWVEPVQFTEDVRDADGGRRDVLQRVMLYDRVVADVGETLLLSVEHEVSPSQGERTIEFYLGYPLLEAAVRVV